MATVTVKDKYQVVIPQALREQLGISCGDVLEARVERGRLTYTPDAAMDRIPANKAERERFFKKLGEQAPSWLKQTWESSKRQGTDKLMMRQINADVAAVRKNSRKNKPAAS